MAVLREVRCSTDGEPGGNGRGFAGHSLSTRRRRIRRLPVPTIADRINADIAAKGLEEDAAPGEQVYFIGPASGPVKIGRSVSVQARLAGLQTASPLKLEILAVVDGGRLLEKFYHCHFAESRLHGEWFNLTDEMLREIKRHAW